jgi:hypothetical protein
MFLFIFEVILSNFTLLVCRLVNLKFERMPKSQEMFILPLSELAFSSYFEIKKHAKKKQEYLMYSVCVPCYTRLIHLLGIIVVLVSGCILQSYKMIDTCTSILNMIKEHFNYKNERF